MQCGNPEILWWLLALIIPILVHLLHFRRYRTVEFSNVSFLTDVEKETKSQQRLKNLLILLLRLIAIASVVIAFADPFIPSDLNSETSASSGIVNIYVDNSYSMQGEGEAGSLLDEAKISAITIVEGHSETERFRIITNDFNGKDSRFLTQEECLDRISSITPAAITRDLNSIVRRASLSNNDATTSSLYLFSDLQKSTHRLSEGFTPDTLLSLYFIPGIANDRPNIWIDSAWFNSPIATVGKQADLNIRINHNSITEVSGLPLMLEIEGERKAVGTYNLKPGLKTDTVLKFSFPEAGIYHAKVSLEDNPIKFDNDYRFGFEVVKDIRVLQICKDKNSKEARSIENVCRSSAPSLSIVTYTNLPSTEELSSYDFIISNGITNPSSGYTSSISTFVKNGGTALIIQDTAFISTRANNLLQSLNFGTEFSWIKTNEPSSFKSLKTENPFYEGIFASSTKSRMDLPKSKYALAGNYSLDVEDLAKNYNGSNAISKTRLGEGTAYLFGLPIEKETGNITNHALFVPLVLRMAESARNASLKAITLGESQGIEFRRVSTQGASYRITDSSGEHSLIPNVRNSGGMIKFGWDNELDSEGNYNVVENKDTIAVFGVNASRLESSQETFDIHEFKKELDKYGWDKAAKVVESRGDNLSELVSKIESGNHLWWYLVLTVIVALAGETILQKRWKTTS